MQIEVLHHYSGRLTGERSIVPGVYASDDPALFGIAPHLLANGHARVLEDGDEPTPPPPPPAEKPLGISHEQFEQAEKRPRKAKLA